MAITEPAIMHVRDIAEATRSTVGRDDARAAALLLAAGLYVLIERLGEGDALAAATAVIAETAATWSARHAH